MVKWNKEERFKNGDMRFCAMIICCIVALVGRLEGISCLYSLEGIFAISLYTNFKISLNIHVSLNCILF